MKYHKHNKRVLLLMSGGLLILGACAPKTPSLGTEPAVQAGLFCSETSPIIYSRLHDTAQTIAQVKAYNAVGQRLCGWGVPGK